MAYGVAAVVAASARAPFLDEARDLHGNLHRHGLDKVAEDLEKSMIQKKNNYK